MIGALAASAKQARALDEAAGRLGVSMDALMALASFQCARLAHRRLHDLPAKSHVAVLAGRGNNGGDGLGCARHLSSWGWVVRTVALGDLADTTTNYSLQARAAQAAGVDLRPAGDRAESVIDWALEGAGLIIDGVLGTGGYGPVRGTVADAVRRINASTSEVLAIDVPSGLDATAGETKGDCVRADVTLMLGAPKSGCLSLDSSPLVGRLWLADIGVPEQAYREVGLAPPNFTGGSLKPFEPTSEPYV